VFKALILLTRREDMTPADFAAWWLNEHRPLAARLPGLRRMVINIVEPDAGAAEPRVDGVSELWFDTRADFDAAYATDLGRAVAEDSLAHVRSRVRLFVSETEVGPASAADAETPRALTDGASGPA
jgi:uncharacterized protein (TIGR02118 family)